MTDGNPNQLQCQREDDAFLSAVAPGLSQLKTLAGGFMTKSTLSPAITLANTVLPIKFVCVWPVLFRKPGR